VNVFSRRIKNAKNAKSPAFIRSELSVLWLQSLAAKGFLAKK
jgi:hypothetical protein